MTVDLPTAISHYFRGKNARDFAMAVSGFAPSAIVKDEGHDHEGPAAIRAWMEATAARYDDRAEVRSVSSIGNRTEVSAQVSGTFPGSPVVLRFNFVLDDDRIVRLEIGS